VIQDPPHYELAKFVFGWQTPPLHRTGIRKVGPVTGDCSQLDIIPPPVHSERAIEKAFESA
jgi:hypothetical protein